jgi:hypothetical protein
MRFDLLAAELEGDVERLDRPKRTRKAADAELAAMPVVRGPGRHAVLEHEAAVTLRATVYLDPDGLVRVRAVCPGGYLVVAEREPTAEELELAMRGGA